MLRHLARAGLVALVALILLPSSAPAAPRTFEKRVERFTAGDIRIAANTVLTCPGACAAERDASGGPTSGGQNDSLSNNGHAMVWVDADGDTGAGAQTLLNSSSARLDLPQGAHVEWAGLYWSGRTQPGTGAPTSQFFKPEERDRVRMRAPRASGYTTIAAQKVDSITSDTSYGTYQGFADVTATVRAAGSGAYWVGDVQAAGGVDRYGGWALVVVFQDPAGTMRSLSVFDGLQEVARTVGNTSKTIPVTGFWTPKSGEVVTKIGAVAYEGDRGAFGDSMELNGVALTNGLNPATNFFNSSVTTDEGGSPPLGPQRPAALDRAPNQPNHFGFDADVFATRGALGNGVQSATFGVETTESTGETFYPGVLTFATDMYAPKIVPVVTIDDLNGGQVEPNDVLEVTTTGTNVGTEHAVDVELRSKLPADTVLLPDTLEVVSGAGQGPQTAGADADRATYDDATRTITWQLGELPAQSVDVGAGYTSRYRVRVAAPANGSSTVAPAESEYEGVETHKRYTLLDEQTPLTVAGPDLVPAIARTGDLVRGQDGAASYTVTVRNTGASATYGPVQVVDDLPAGLEPATEPASGDGWSCAPSGTRITCTRSDALAPGASYPPLTVPVRVRRDAPASITNTVVVTGGSDGIHTNDTASNGPAGGVTRAPLTVALTRDAAEIGPGDAVRFTARVRNAGPSDAAGVKLTIPTPSGLERVSATVGGVACATAECVVGTLEAGAEAEAVFTFRAARAAAGTTQAAATSASSATDPGTPSASASVDVREQRDVRVTQTLVPAVPVAGSPARLTIEVANHGPTTASGVVLTEELPALLTGAEVTIEPGKGSCAIADGTLTCTLAPLADGATAALKVRGVLPSDARGETLRATARIAAVPADVSTADDDATVSEAVTALTDLGVTVASAPATVHAGLPLDVRLSVTNGGPSDATATRLTLPVPAGLALGADGTDAACAADAGQVVCDLGRLAPGTRSVELRFHVDAARPAGPVALTPVVGAAEPDSPAHADTASTGVGVTRAADLELTLDAAPTTLVAGDTAQLTARVVNRGPSTARDARVALTLPAQLELVAARVGETDCAGATCDLGSLAVAGDATVVAVVRARRSAGGTTPAVQAAAISADLDPDADDARDVRTLTVQPRRGVSVSQAVVPGAPVAGAPLRLDLVVENAGPSDASGVVLTEALPASLREAVATIDAAQGTCAVGAGTLRCELPQLADGARVPVRVTGTLAPDAGRSTLTLRASVDAVEADAGTGDDVAELTPTVRAIADIALSAVRTPERVRAGERADWVVRAVNDGPSDGAQAVLRLPLPADVRLADVAGATGCTTSAGVLTCALGTLPAGGAREVRLTLAVASTAPAGELVLRPAVASGAEDPDTDDATVEQRTEVVRAADLRADVAAPASAPVAGTRTTFRAVLRNAGPSLATDAALVLRAAAGLADTSARLADGTPCALDGPTWRCATSRLAVGDELVAEVTGVVPRDGGGRRVAVAAATHGAEADPQGSGEEPVGQVDAVSVADLSAGARAPRGVVEAGRTATYALIAHNEGPSDGTGVVVRSGLPPEADVVRLDGRCRLEGRIVTCAVGTLAPGESAELEVLVRARVRFDGAVLGAGAAVHGSVPDPERANDGALAEPAPRTCTSRRNFRIRLRVPGDVRVGAVTARVAGRTVPARRRGRMTVDVDLRGMPKGRVVVDLRVRTSDGVRTGRRVYHLCETKRRPGGRIPI